MTPILELQDLSFRYEGGLPGEKVLDALTFETPKTREMAAVMKALGAEKALVVLNEKDESVLRASGNIQALKLAYVNTINVYDILKYDKLVILQAALPKVEEVYA